MVLLAGWLAVAACGGDDDDEAGAEAPIGGGFTFAVTMEPDPARSQGPVTWSLEVGNAGVEAVTLTFPSSQRGNVVLRRRGRTAVAYRWSTGRFFSEAVIEDRLRPNEEKVYRLKEDKLAVPPGEYDFEVTLKASPAPDPVRGRIKVVAGEAGTTSTTTTKDN